MKMKIIERKTPLGFKRYVIIDGALCDLSEVPLAELSESRKLPAVQEFLLRALGRLITIPRANAAFVNFGGSI